MNDMGSVPDWIRPTTFVLESIDLYNWGPFGGRHHVDIDPGGTAIIGPTGSGKTTIVDALMTLIVAQPRYNLASTGGLDSDRDRDLISYIRGHTGAGNDSGDNRHISRPGKTVTGIGARLLNRSQFIQLAAVFWLDSSSSASADRKELWLVSERVDVSLDEWLMIHHEGGSRALKQHVKDVRGIKVFENKRSYLAHVRRLFEVNENAFTLLNRAAGLKQLSSIDDIFRELVLDNHAQFVRAAEVAREFDDLTAIYQELELARNQQLSLQPVAAADKRYVVARERLEETHSLIRMLPVWYGIAGARLWQARLDELDVELKAVDLRIHEGELALERSRAETGAAYQRFLNLGGAQIEHLKDQMQTQLLRVKERRHYAEQYAAITARLGLNAAIDATSFEQNRGWAKLEFERLQHGIDLAEKQTYADGAVMSQHQKAVAELEAELKAAQARPDSNLPPRFQTFRAELAAALNTAVGSLPFVAELIEVKPEQADWRGAIERAIGGHRFRILTPSEYMKAALVFVNNRDNRLHVRLLDASHAAGTATFFEDGFARKLNFKTHALREPLKKFVGGIDRHCVDSPEQLQGSPHSMTRQGLMSGVTRQFDKQDQEPLDRNWVTGFSNVDLLTSVGSLLDLRRAELAEAVRVHDVARNAVRSLRDTLSLVTQLTTLEFETIDVPKEEAQLQSIESRLRLLSSDNSDAGKARLQYEHAQAEQEKIDARLRSLSGERGAINERISTARSRFDSASQRSVPELTEQEARLASARLPDLVNASVEVLDNSERELRAALEKDASTSQEALSGLAQRIVSLMGAAQKIDNGALAEAGTDLEDVPAYLERLRVLTEEALPEKLNRFQNYLTQSSDQGVAQLLADIDNEVSMIEDRIAELNATLKRVDFQENRFVQLVPRRVIHERLQTLSRASAKVRSASLAADDGESHYRALKDLIAILREAVDRRRTNAAQALLDPRYRLRFSYSVLDRDTGEVVESRTSSQGGSGGEKEIIASYILTASLSYALCPDGSDSPLFGTIVLDEAFSKSSQAVAGRIISALKEFGLHPVFVTPNKEMRLLRDHTRSAILVHRKDMRSTVTSFSWEVLEEHARQRKESTVETP